jgi:hypothetical protein
LPLRDTSGNLGLRIFIPGEPLNIGIKGLETVVETGIGEREFALIRHLEYSQSPDVLHRDAWLELRELPKFLELQEKEEQ